MNRSRASPTTIGWPICPGGNSIVVRNADGSGRVQLAPTSSADTRLLRSHRMRPPSSGATIPRPASIASARTAPAISCSQSTVGHRRRHGRIARYGSTMVGQCHDFDTFEERKLLVRCDRRVRLRLRPDHIGGDVLGRTELVDRWHDPADDQGADAPGPATELIVTNRDGSSPTPVAGVPRPVYLPGGCRMAGSPTSSRRRATEAPSELRYVAAPPPPPPPPPFVTPLNGLRMPATFSPSPA